MVNHWFTSIIIIIIHRHDMGTWTKEDGIIVDGKKKEPLAKLANPENRKGPSFLNIM